MFLCTHYGIAQFAAQKLDHPASISPNKEKNGLWIHYDSGESDNALGLSLGGEFQSAIRWEPSDLSYLNGMQITSVRVYINDMPNSAAIIIYQGADEASLQPMLFHVYEPVAESWNEIILDSPVVIDTSLELWISSQVDDPGQNIYPLGMDTTIEDAVGFGNMVNLGDGWEILTDLVDIPGVFSLRAFVEPASVGEHMVNFRVNMAPALTDGFDPAIHNVYIAGDFLNWPEPGSEGSVQLTMETKTKKNTVLLEEGFEGDVFPPEGWVIADEDGDGHNWFNYDASGSAYTGEQSAASASWHDGTILTPDNWLISPALNIDNDSYILEYFVGAQDPDWAEDTYAVLISTTGIDPSNFTSVWEETLADADWHLREIDLSAYTGEQIHVAFRHYNSVDWFYIKIDDVKVYGTNDDPQPDDVFFSAAVEIPTGDIAYKYFSDAFGQGWNGGEWEGDPNRVIEVSQNMTINDTWGVYEGVLHTLTLNAHPYSAGTVSGQGQYPYGTEVTLNATPNQGYSFINWTDEQGNFISNNSNYIYTMPAGSITLTANFELEDPGLQLVSFQIKDSYYNPLHNAQITVVSDNKSTGSIISETDPVILLTNYQGYASFYAYSGDYSYTVVKPGFISVTGNFSVENAPVTIPVHMQNDTQMYTVTFNLNMIYAPPGFDPNEHTIYLTGDLNDWTEPGQEGSIELIHMEGNIFSTTLGLQAGEYYYLYFSDAYGEGWEGGESYDGTLRTLGVYQNMTVNDVWGLYSDDFFELSLQASPDGSGTLSGSGQYQAGETVHLQAVPSDGFIFLNWTDEYDNIINENSGFQYIMQAMHHTLTANFAEGEPGQYLLTLEAAPNEGGQVSGDGLYNQGEPAIVSAAPNQGYVFHNWRKNGTVVGTQAQMVYTMPAENTKLTAHFYSEDNPLYTLTLQQQPQVGGTVSGAGDYHEGEEIVLSAIPAEGYGFIRWLEMGSGNTYTESAINYSMPAQDITLIAYFDLVDFVHHYENPDLKLFPNPAQYKVTISSTETINKIEITDITGKLIYHSGTQDTEILVSLASWENGIYIVRIFTSEQVFLKKLHIQK